MTDALTSMRAVQQACRSHRKLRCAKPCMRQAENTAVGQSPQGWRTPQEGRKRLTAEELRERLENDPGEKWSETDEELRSRFVQAVNDRFAPY